MKGSTPLFAALAALVPLALAHSQRTPPSPAQMAESRVSHYTTLLSLSASQVQEATTVYTAEAESESTLRSSERTAHEALDAAVKNGDTSAIEQASSTLGQLDGQRTAAHATADAKFYATLTADQKAKFSELERGHGMRGPEGPPPPQ